MRTALFSLVLLAPALVGGCGRNDVAVDPALDPGDAFVVRDYTLENGERVWVEALVEDDMGLRRAVLDIEDGLTVEDLVEELAMGHEYELVLDSDHEVLIIEIDEDPRAWIWPGAQG
jgi:hypothetical protein